MNYAVYVSCELEGEHRVCFLGARHFFFQAESLIVDFVSNEELDDFLYNAEADTVAYTVVEI